MLRAWAHWSVAKVRVPSLTEVKIVLGAAHEHNPGWILTWASTLDVTQAAHFERLLAGRSADAFLAEHVWEHLDAHATQQANALCFRYLRSGGHLRLAVPDGLHPDPDYIAQVRPGGTGIGAEDHRVLYDHRMLCASLQRAGFETRLLEYWDEHGQFHHRDWDSRDGHVVRSRRYDARNRNDALRYTSLIVDALKP